MKPTNLWIFRTSLAALALATASTTFAQNEDKQKDKQREQEQRQREQNKNQNSQANRNAQLLQGTDIMDCTVVSEDNQNLGTIKNLALDMDNGRALYVIVDNADNNKLIPVPLQALNFTREAKKARVNINKQRWQDSPDFEESNWGVINDANWVRIVYQHYGLDSPFNQQSAAKMDIAKATDVLGMKCVDRDNREELGQCKDFLIQDRTSAVPFIVIEADRRSGNEKNVAVPTQLVNLSKNDKRLVLKTETTKLANAPAFNRGALENQQQFAQRVFSHFDVDGNVYGYTPPRDNNNNNNNDRDRDRDNPQTGDNRENWQSNSRYGQLYDRSNIIQVEGRITRVQRVTPMQGMDPGIAITVQNSNDREQVVHLGPAWFIERQQSQFQEGDQVRVIGARANHQNEQFIMANVIEEGNRAMLLRDRQGVPAWDAWHTAQDLRNSDQYPQGGNRNRNNTNNNNNNNNDDDDDDDDDRDDD